MLIFKHAISKKNKPITSSTCFISNPLHYEESLNKTLLAINNKFLMNINLNVNVNDIVIFVCKKIV